MRTLFDTPVLTPLLRFSAGIVIKWKGWQVKGVLPSAPKFVLIAAPHTSSWDGFYMLTVAFLFRVKIHWLGKKSLFFWPVGPFLKWLGGIPVDRSTSNSMVSQAAALINKADRIVLAVPPEGTRKRVSKLKTGFYYMALEAKVPIALGFLDYRKKTAGVGPTIQPTGDYEADLKVIRAFYSGMTGKYENQSALTQSNDIKN